MMQFFKKEQSILEIYADIFIFLIIILFPLMVDFTGFFKILECKWHCYLIIATSYLVLNILTILYFLIFKKTNIFRRNKITTVQWLLILFWIINVISTFSSPFLKTHNLFVGVGRGEGLIMVTLYTISCLFVTIFAKFKKKYVFYFSLSSLLLSLVGFLQYLGFNPFNMYQETIGIHNVSFISTIGNIDFMSALYCLFIPISFGSYLFLEENKYHNIIYILSIFFGFIMICIMGVSSVRLALFATLIIFLPFIVDNNKKLSRFLILISSIFMAYCVNIILNIEYHYNSQSLGIHLQFNYIVILFLIVITLLIYLSHILKSTNYNVDCFKKLYKYYYFFLLICSVLCVVVLYFVNFNSGFLYEIHELLHGNFDDNFGTYRIFLWKRALNLVIQYPLLGTGADTFVIRFMAQYTDDIARMQNGIITLNDTAANVYLTMLVNIGVIGLLSYLTFIVSLIKKVIKKINKYSFILLTSLVCFLIQDFFNLTVVIVTPLFWILIAILYRSIYSERSKK